MPCDASLMLRRKRIRLALSLSGRHGRIRAARARFVRGGCVLSLGTAFVSCSCDRFVRGCGRPGRCKPPLSATEPKHPVGRMLRTGQRAGAMLRLLVVVQIPHVGIRGGNQFLPAHPQNARDEFDPGFHVRPDVQDVLPIGFQDQPVQADGPNDAGGLGRCQVDGGSKAKVHPRGDRGDEFLLAALVARNLDPPRFFQCLDELRRRWGLSPKGMEIDPGREDAVSVPGFVTAGVVLLRHLFRQPAVVFCRHVFQRVHDLSRGTDAVEADGAVVSRCDPQLQDKGSNLRFHRCRQFPGVGIEMEIVQTDLAHRNVRVFEEVSLEGIDPPGDSLGVFVVVVGTARRCRGTRRRRRRHHHRPVVFRIQFVQKPRMNPQAGQDFHRFGFGCAVARVFSAGRLEFQVEERGIITGMGRHQGHPGQVLSP
mmetsp:Transcript_12022/g.27113  ORF Transcript_12022/g.27113 Transcript_12022/m.27113 type:complete len:424 (+) Transcript_12022:39-1310(+)